MRRFSAVLLALVAMAVIAAACSSLPAPAVVAYTAADYSFAGPDSFAGGEVKLTLNNTGREIHHMQLVRLEEGKTAQDLFAALQQPNAAAPSWMKEAGGPSVAAPVSPAGPGGTSNVTQRLEPGNYVMLCLIPNAQGVPHVALGMAKPITVTAPAVRAKPPTAKATIVLKDFSFDVKDTLPAGKTVFHVENRGQQHHEAFLFSLAPGKSAADALTFIEGQGPPGPPPFAPANGIQGIEARAEGWFETDLKPGNYGLLCFVPDTRTSVPEADRGKPHFALGMIREFTVK